MTAIDEELLQIADRLDEWEQRSNSPDANGPLIQLEEAAIKVGKAWSGSWLGYHARVYYENLQPPPPGAHFSQEWGIGERHSSLGSKGDWREFNGDNLEKEIRKLAGNPNLDEIKKLAGEASKSFENEKSEISSILSTAITGQNDKFLTGLKEQEEKLSLFSRTDIIQGLRPSGEFMTRDTIVFGQGYQTPPHFLVLSETVTLKHPFTACSQLAQIARKAGSHLSRKQRSVKRSSRIGTNVFIGHGNSLMWRELKDFINDRLSLPWDEFNRVPIAGVTNIARLSEMLDAAAIAFLIMTGEDEQVDGKVHARMNVVHEAGLFQGRLGFTRAIVLLEEGCEEFSNVEGLGQIRFSKGNIKAAFEDVRKVLERESILKP